MTFALVLALGGCWRNDVACLDLPGDAGACPAPGEVDTGALVGACGLEYRVTGDATPEVGCAGLPDEEVECEDGDLKCCYPVKEHRRDKCVY